MTNMAPMVLCALAVQAARGGRDSPVPRSARPGSTLCGGRNLFIPLGPVYDRGGGGGLPAAQSENVEPEKKEEAL